MAQLMPLPLAVSCFSKIEIGFTFPVPTHPGSPGKRAVKRVCVCVCMCVCVSWFNTEKLQKLNTGMGAKTLLCWTVGNSKPADGVNLEYLRHDGVVVFTLGLVGPLQLKCIVRLTVIAQLQLHVHRLLVLVTRNNYNCYNNNY